MGVGAEEPAAPVVEIKAPASTLRCGDDAVEGSGDALVGLQGDDAGEVGAEGFHVALCGGDVGALGLVVGLLLVAVLAGEDALGYEDAVAVHGDLGEGELGLLLSLLGLGLAKLLAGLVDLLVEIGSVDGGEELALVDVVTYVYVTFLEITVGTGVDGGFREGRGGSGDDETRAFLGALDADDIDERFGVFCKVCTLGSLLVAVVAGDGSDNKDDRKDDDDGGDDPVEDLVGACFSEGGFNGFFDGAVVFFCAGVGLLEALADLGVVDGVGVGEGFTHGSLVGKGRVGELFAEAGAVVGVAAGEVFAEGSVFTRDGVGERVADVFASVGEAVGWIGRLV